MASSTLSESRKCPASKPGLMETRASLLLRIRNPQDTQAWREFVELYAPLLHSYAMKNRLQDADAADLAQDTLRLVLRAAPEFIYEPAKGSFRGWLFTIARNQIRKFFTRRASHAQGSGDSEVREFLSEQPAESEQSAWDQEYQLHLFHWAARRVESEFRPASWQAFWRTVVLSEDICKVASDLQITTGAVYIARSRITNRIRQEIQSAQGEEP